MNVIVDNLPMPSDETPWEAILEFRSDPDSRRKLSHLKVWMHEIAKSNIDRIECEEKLAWLKQEFESHLRIHKLKTSYGAVEAMVTTTAEIAENLVKIKWGKAAKTLFSLGHERIELLEAESRAPGREIAYIVKAENAFKSG